MSPWEIHLSHEDAFAQLRPFLPRLAATNLAFATLPGAGYYQGISYNLQLAQACYAATKRRLIIDCGKAWAFAVAYSGHASVHLRLHKEVPLPVQRLLAQHKTPVLTRSPASDDVFTWDASATPFSFEAWLVSIEQQISSAP